MSFQDHPYADFLHKVSKPARYVGGEHLSVVKDWDTLDAKMVLAFPDAVCNSIAQDVAPSSSDTTFRRSFNFLNSSASFCFLQVSVITD